MREALIFSKLKGEKLLRRRGIQKLLWKMMYLWMHSNCWEKMISD
jgi:hypothetical protein